MVVHDEPCDQCTRHGTVCEGPEGQSCSLCKNVLHRSCAKATHGRAKKRAREEEEEKGKRSAKRRAPLPEGAGPSQWRGALQNDGRLPLDSVARPETEMERTVAELARDARQLFRDRDRMRSIAEGMMAALARIQRDLDASRKKMKGKRNEPGDTN